MSSAIRAMKGSSSTSAAAASTISVARLINNRISSCGVAEKVSRAELPRRSRYTSLLICGKKSTATRVWTPSSSHNRNTSSSSASRWLSTEDHLVDHVLAKQFRQLGQRLDGIRLAQLYVLLPAPVLIGQKAGEPYAISSGLLDLATDAQRRFDQPYHQDVIGRAEFAPHPSEHPAGVQTKQALQHPGGDDKHAEEGAAQIQAQQEFKEHHCGSAQQALPEGVPQNGARMGGIDAIINAPPGAQRHPHQHRPTQQQHRHRNRQKEIVLEGEAPLVHRGPRPIGDSKRQRGKKNIGETKKNPDLAMVSSEHAVRIALVQHGGEDGGGDSG